MSAAAPKLRTAYGRLLSEALFGGPPPGIRRKWPRPIRRLPVVLTLPDFLADRRCHTVDWSSTGTIVVALGREVYVMSFRNGNIEEYDVDDLPLDGDVEATAARWSPGGQGRIVVAAGDGPSSVSVAEIERGGNPWSILAKSESPVGCIACHENLVTFGDFRGKVRGHDVRSPAKNAIMRFSYGIRGIHAASCGIEWSTDGRYLAAGGQDGFISVWDVRKATKHCLHRLDAHRKSWVRALDWKHDILVSGGCEGDACIRFWDIRTGTCLDSLDTLTSEVCALRWSPDGTALLSSHGGKGNPLMLWTYPEMDLVSNCAEQISPALSMVQSPNGCTVATASGEPDATLRFFSVFADPKPTRIGHSTHSSAFQDWPRSYIR